jgi:nicotinamidase/pyrazinamidase
MYNRSAIASFDVDAQKTFTPLCPNELPVPEGHLIADALNEQATFASVRVGSKDAHTPHAVWVATQENPQFSEVNLPNSDIRWNLHAVPGTEGFELLDKLPAVEDYDFFVWKGVEPNIHPYGACYHNLNWQEKKMSTGVIEFLKLRGIKLVLVGGLATDFCVKNTALQLKDAGFDVVLNLKASRGVAVESTQSAVAELSKAGVNVVADISSYLSTNEQQLGL